MRRRRPRTTVPAKARRMKIELQGCRQRLVRFQSSKLDFIHSLMVRLCIRLEDAWSALQRGERAWLAMITLAGICPDLRLCT